MENEIVDIDLLIKKVLSYNPDADIELLKQAHLFSNKAHGSQKGAPGIVRGVVKSPCDVVIVSHDADPFSESGKKRLLGLVLHERESA